MNPEMSLIWQELQSGSNTPVLLWQVSVIALGLLLAWSVNGILRAYVMRRAAERWKVGIGGINRVLFPLSSLIFVYCGYLLLRHWQDVSLLKLAMTLLLAMAVIRLVVYALRYIFTPGGWVRTMEGTVASIVWLVLALHLIGVLPDILTALDGVRFTIGKGELTLLLLLQAILIILVTLFGALWISRLIENRLMGAEQINMNVRVVLSKLVRIFFSLIAVLFALSAVGLDITLLSVFGGALGVGLGFGLQKIASNYASGFILLLDDSIHIGDIVTVDTHYGIVSELRSRYMVLRKLDNTEVIIPNETLVSNVMVNHSMTDRKVRVQLSLQVSYQTDLELAMRLMLEAATTQERVLRDPAPNALLRAFGDSGIDLVMNIWISDPENGTASLQSEINLDIWRAFKKHNVSIPYPQREIRILSSEPPAPDVAGTVL
ncbi:MAG: mechanosensitive ion channel protein MscS [Betaproteobacteria bacterium HGW-Betaproteobacteria-1]|jgi:small-conductance mechanosensitive channel|nr:MAG: mechanosensitive ion channel protein MscS [Betaproteobacteria bacterium HGW-Betaproteobacteria-1]